jgi:hypothetical protein
VFPSLLRSGALTATQFHPEKSGPAGRALLAAFAAGLLDGLATSGGGSSPDADKRRESAVASSNTAGFNLVSRDARETDQFSA